MAKFLGKFAKIEEWYKKIKREKIHSVNPREELCCCYLQQKDASMVQKDKKRKTKLSKSERRTVLLLASFISSRGFSP